MSEEQNQNAPLTFTVTEARQDGEQWHVAARLNADHELLSDGEEPIIRFTSPTELTVGMCYDIQSIELRNPTFGTGVPDAEISTDSQAEPSAALSSNMLRYTMEIQDHQPIQVAVDVRNNAGRTVAAILKLAREGRSMLQRPSADEHSPTPGHRRGVSSKTPGFVPVQDVLVPQQASAATPPLMTEQPQVEETLWEEIAPAGTAWLILSLKNSQDAALVASVVSGHLRGLKAQGDKSYDDMQVICGKNDDVRVLGLNEAIERLASELTQDPTMAEFITKYTIADTPIETVSAVVREVDPSAIERLMGVHSQQFPPLS